MDADRLFYLRPKGALFHPLPPLHDRLTGGDPHTNHNHLSLTARSRKAERKRASGESKGVIGYGGLPPEGSRSWGGKGKEKERNPLAPSASPWGKEARSACVLPSRGSFFVLLRGYKGAGKWSVAW